MGGKRRSARWLWLLELVACVVGLAVAVKLAFLHVRVHHDPTVQSFCAINESINCDSVALSSYSVFLGVPVAVWGIIGYVVMGTVAWWGYLRRSTRAPTVVQLGLTSGAVVVSGVLGWIAVTAIRSLCILCATTYLVNALLAVIAWRRVVREGFADAIRDAKVWIAKETVPLGVSAIVGIIGISVLVGAFPRYWETDEEARETSLDGSARRTSNGEELERGVTEEGHPWIGAVNPQLTIVEFSDYQCPFCSRRHQELRDLVESQPQQVRLVHRHYPLDDACNPTVTRRFHPRACQYAHLAACAGEAGRFWEANDYLYANGRSRADIAVADLASAVGIDAAELERCLDQKGESVVRTDIDAGISLGIRGTPSFVVDHKLYMGKIPEEVVAPYLHSGVSLESRGSG